jgi:hypothetical protein
MSISSRYYYSIALIGSSRGALLQMQPQQSIQADAYGPLGM